MQSPAPGPAQAEPTKDPQQRPPQRPQPAMAAPRELGGPAGPEPTRFGDWEKAGRCIDF